jgi:hypothetical protein
VVASARANIGPRPSAPRRAAPTMTKRDATANSVTWSVPLANTCSPSSDNAPTGAASASVIQSRLNGYAIASITQVSTDFSCREVVSCDAGASQWAHVNSLTSWAVHSPHRSCVATGATPTRDRVAVSVAAGGVVAA